MPASEADVLTVLARADGEALSTTEIAAALEISQPGAWRRLEKLEAADLVVRTPGEDTVGDRWSLSEEVREELESED